MTAGDAAYYDSFGYSVAISGNYAVVGAYRNDDNGAGSAYAFPLLNVSLTADHEIIEIGDSITLSWHSTIIAGHCSIEPSVGTVEGEWFFRTITG